MIHFLFVLTLSNAFIQETNVNCNSGYCTQCGNDKECTSCLYGYVLKNGECIWFEDLHCNEFDSSSCLDCEEGYILTLNLECIQCSNHTNCLELDDDTCDGNCISCGNYAYLNEENVCENDDNFCYKYNETGSCVECIEFYYLDESDNKCKEGSIDNCRVYEDSTLCQTCLNGLQEGTECYECGVDHCIECLNDQYLCSNCESGYQESDDEKQCFECNLDNCKKCVDLDGSKCDECHKGYFLDSSTQLCVTCQVDNCEECSEDQNHCEDNKCENGYYPNEDYTECVSCGDYCNVCTDTTTCKQCVDGYWLNKTTSTPSCDVCMDNCEKCSTSDSCNQCADGYYYDNAIDVPACVSCFDHCEKCNDESTCNKCEDGYQASNDKQQCFVCNLENCDECVNLDGSQCFACDNNYFVNENTGLCEICAVDNCDQCSDDKNTCGSCSTGYKSVDGNCEACPTGCAKCSEDVTKCEKCASGYFINEQFLCEACASECIKSITQVDNIEKCVNSKYTCVVNENHCIRLSENGVDCIECEVGFSIDSGKCYYYREIVGYDDNAYKCLLYPDDADEYESGDYVTEVYEPVDGECENLAIDDGCYSMAVVVILVIVTLLI